jgi:hypothetical protein
VLLDGAILKLLLLAHVGATLIMVGVIWTIQIVHYPLFSAVGAAGFAAYEAEHTRRITFVVAPLMLAELATAALFVWQQPDGMTSWMAWIGAGLVAAIWLSTYFLQVPQHTVLGSSFDAAAHRFLVLTNWIRTVCWSLRGMLMLWILARLIS